ncbi:MAG: hypothetical protein L3J71_15215 [Victivallaceae bacterium]|nr:hypothetical protein [Victivallaceae bacterium]
MVQIAKMHYMILKDIAVNPAEKEYNRRDAEKAVSIIEEALRIREQQAVHQCQHLTDFTAKYHGSFLIA